MNCTGDAVVNAKVIIIALCIFYLLYFFYPFFRYRCWRKREEKQLVKNMREVLVIEPPVPPVPPVKCTESGSEDVYAKSFRGKGIRIPGGVCKRCREEENATIDAEKHPVTEDVLVRRLAAIEKMPSFSDRDIYILIYRKGGQHNDSEM